tara:strand:+ start:2416 stop:3144 length:729 start_codon:yes stop_codon:yes gene_type:complete
MVFNSSSKFNEYTASGDIPSSSSSNSYVWARDAIALRTTKESKIPFFYKESLRYIISKLGSLSYINAEDKVTSIKCIHANPERTVAKLHQENNIILPVISIDQETSDNDDGRRRNSPSLVIEKYWSEEKRRAFRLISLAPRPVNISYGINIWAKYKSNMDQIVEQIRLLFNPHLVITNPYTNVASAFLESEADESTLDAGDREDRVLRKSFAISLEAYVPNPQFLITSTGEIEEFNTDATIY